MKKTFLFVILIFFVSFLLNAQPKCVDDVKYALVIQKEVPRARKIMEEECFPGNESNADVWLVRGNVFIQLYEYEIGRKSKDPKYVIRWTDAIVTANESFYKALELKPDITGSAGLIDSKDGQLLSAPPIHDLAAKAMDNKDFTEAIRLLNLVIRSYRVDIKGYALYLAYAYLDLANCYYALGEVENYKKILIDATRLSVPEPIIYLNLYDIFKQDNDTVKCGEILNQAFKAVPDSLSIDVKGYELDYFAMIGDTVKLKSAAIKMFEQYQDNIEVINIIVTHLINNKEYLLAQEMIEVGLAINSNSFEMNNQMTYRYYNEAVDYEKIKEEKLNEKPRKFLEAEAALNKTNELLGIAVEWAEKAYNIYKDDKQHNMMYSQILVRLALVVPDDLKEKVDSYRQR